MKQRNPTNAGDKSQPAGRISQDTDSLTTLLSDDADLAIEDQEPRVSTKNKGKEGEHDRSHHEHENLKPYQDGYEDIVEGQEAQGPALEDIETDHDEPFDENGTDSIPHWKIWNNLVRQASQNGIRRYTHAPESGNHPMDVTAYLGSQASWGQRRESRPAVLSVWLPSAPRTHPTYDIGNLTYCGRRVLDVQGNIIRDFRCLPLTISSKVAGWRVEAWTRTDSRMKYGDIVARMKTQTTPRGRKPIYGARALASRTRNFRDHAGLVSWTTRNTLPASVTYMDNLRTPAQMASNKTTDKDLTFKQLAEYHATTRNVSVTGPRLDQGNRSPEASRSNAPAPASRSTGQLSPNRRLTLRSAGTAAPGTNASTNAREGTDTTGTSDATGDRPVEGGRDNIFDFGNGEPRAKGSLRSRSSNGESPLTSVGSMPRTWSPSNRSGERASSSSLHLEDGDSVTVHQASQDLFLDWEDLEELPTFSSLAESDGSKTSPERGLADPLESSNIETQAGDHISISSSVSSVELDSFPMFEDLAELHGPRTGQEEEPADSLALPALDKQAKDTVSVSSSDVFSEPEDLTDARNDYPIGGLEMNFLQDALDLTINDFKQLTCRKPVEASWEDNYFSQWAVYQSQLNSIWTELGNAEVPPTLFGLDKWTDGILNWKTADLAPNDRFPLEEIIEPQIQMED